MRGLAWMAAVLLVAAAGPVRAQETSLRVGVIERPPFAIRTDDGAWLGMGIDFWRLAAENLGLSYSYVDLGQTDPAEALRTGQVDVVLPAETTPELEAAADATQPFYTATLGVATKHRSRLLSVIEGFASLQFLRLVLGLSALLLVVGALVWALERRGNEDQFNRSVLRGLGDGFWWAGVTLTTIGYGDKAPVTLAGRAVAMLWMLVGLAVSAALTATIVTLAGLSAQVDVPEVFNGRSVGTVEGSTAALFLERENVESRGYATVEDALRGIEAGEVEVVAAAAPVLRHAVDENAAFDLVVRTTRLDPHYMSFALPAGSPLREPLDIELLRRLASESGLNLIERYLPEGTAQ